MPALQDLGRRTRQLRNLVEPLAAAVFFGLNIAKMSLGASCQDFAVKAHFRRS